MRYFVVFVLFLYGCSSKLIHTEFLSDPCIKPVKNYLYKTCTEIRFKVEDDEYVIPKNFETDLATIPRFAWSFVSPFYSHFFRPAIVHDFFYRKSCDFDRRQADIIFYSMLRNEGLSDLKASCIYYLIRIFGGKYYTEDYCEHDSEEPN